jgi:arsenate reductase-like glutaredoxin family protein
MNEQKTGNMPATNTSALPMDASPLTELLKTTRNYISMRSTSKDLSRILEKTHSDLEKLFEKHAEVFDKYPEGSDEAQMIEDVFDIVCELDEAVMNQEPFEGIKEIADIMEELNNKFVKTFQNCLKESPVHTEEDLIRAILEELSEDDFITSNYVRIEESSIKYLENKISKDDYEYILNEMKEIIQLSRSGYEDSYISHSEWTMEVALGDKLFLEGLTEWEESLNHLSACIPTKIEEDIMTGLDMLLEANKKLVMVQILAKKVNEQAEKMEKLKRGQSF